MVFSNVYFKKDDNTGLIRLTQIPSEWPITEEKMAGAAAYALQLWSAGQAHHSNISTDTFLGYCQTWITYLHIA